MSDSSQGPGWWQASDGKWYPPEQAPGSGPAPGPANFAAAGGGGGKVDIGGAISYGWNKFTANAGPLIVAVLFIWVVNFVVALIGVPITNRGGIFVQFFWQLIGIAIGAIVSMGIVRMALALVKGEPIDMSMAIPSGPLIVPYAITGVIVSIVVGIGTLLCIIPCIIAATFLLFAHFAVLDEGLQPGDAIKRSIDLVKPHFGAVLGFMIVAFLVNLVGVILCFVGLLATIPLTIVAGAHVYRGLQGQPVAA
jgi:uncharacterized membrane protein